MLTSGFHMHANTCANTCMRTHTDAISVREKSVRISLGLIYPSQLLHNLGSKARVPLNFKLDLSTSNKAIKTTPPKLYP